MPGKRRRQRRQQQSLLRFLVLGIVLAVVLVHVHVPSGVKAFTPPPSTNKNKHKHNHVFLQVLHLYLPRRQARSSRRIGSSGTTGRSTVLQQQQRNTSSSSSNNNNRIEEDADSSNDVQDASNTTTIQTSSSSRRRRNLSTILLTRISRGYQRRINADRQFVQKSLVEILVAAGTQLMAEWNRRGSFRTILLQIDFVVPAVLTAVFGKYYSMWKTAKTLDDDNLDDGRDHGGNTSSSIDISSGSETTTDPTFFGIYVPTNAFQARMADGTTIPTVQQRVFAFVVPMPALFRAGILASGVGYGLAAVLVSLRTVVVPSYVTGTVPVNIVAAALYTGCFMALVSNVRYQILQGLIEPILIDRWLFPATTPCSEEDQHPRQQQQQHQQKQHNDANTNSNVDGKSNSTTTATCSGSRHRRPRIPMIFRPVLIFVIRWLNGLLGSVLAINGMRLCGLQRMKG